MVAKPPDPALVPTWNFQNTSGNLKLPAPSSFEVRTDDQVIAVARVGFKRRPLYAPLRNRDLRVGNWLYLELASPIATGKNVQLRILDPRIGDVPLALMATASADRLNPVIHVNQEGYLPDLPKVARIGAFLGTMGEFQLPANIPFDLIDFRNGDVVFRGTTVRQPDVGFNTNPLPYQQVLAADFSSFARSGQYKLRVTGLGMSSPFRIGEDIAALFARTYALGLYHQRCGAANTLPYTRFTHGICHDELAAVPTINNTFVTKVLNDMTSDWKDNPRHTAPRLSSINASLYPFLRTNDVDVIRGHHDAGDYSKYTINSAQFIHHLVFAVDAFPNVAKLDNLGLPESGDKRSDLLQIAKWEADFLVKMQDLDGGFYFLVYPATRKYEDNVLPDNHDKQIVFPKNTSATAAASAALAQIGSSPLFRNSFPEDAARFLSAARQGWNFLQTAIAKFGRDGSYQKISHYGDVFMHDDELSWLASELFAATGDSVFETDLKDHFNPSSRDTRRWTWWRAFEGYGCALRSYAFAARTGRLPASALDPSFLAACEAEIVYAAEDVDEWSQECAYGTSFPDASKRQRAAGWYFSIARAFDLAVAHQLQTRSKWMGSIVSHINYEAGSNPLNICFITGLGLRRPSILISQYALNDDRFLPPSGYPIGQLQTGYSWTDMYKSELGNLCLPSDNASTNDYPLYDRWGDAWNTTTEAVSVDQARGLATLAFLMARTPLRDQPWTAVPASIKAAPGQAPGVWSCSFTANDSNLNNATIIWETMDQTAVAGTDFTMTILHTGEQFVEAEAQLPDGRRLFASKRFLAACAPDTNLSTVTISAPDPDAAWTPFDSGRFEIVRDGDISKPLNVSYALGGTARNGDH